MLYSVVVPVYNSERSLDELYKRVRDTFEHEVKEEFELVLVDDSSRDNSFSVMENLRRADSRVKIIQLSRNYGQHSALLCGMNYSKGDFIITMDDDLQHPPEEIPKLIKEINEREDLDVVIGAYVSKKHGIIRNLGTYMSNLVTAHVFGNDPNLKLTSFRIMRRFVTENLLQMKVSYPRIGHLLLLVSNRIGNVTVEHDKRQYGKSGYSFKRLVKDFFHNISNNTALPLIFLRNIGLFAFVLSGILGLYYMIRYFVVGISIAGWTTIILVLLFFSGLTLLGLGIVGEYLYRVLEETKKLPNYMIRKSNTD
ncbi:MAG: glycosyltransferase family 2 protein [Lachnospiraceae bacterium]|nr:glycosyltransferase family 2 protein [Lachnospiraceae bacterium]